MRNEDRQCNKKEGANSHKLHMFLMALCCVIPISLLLILPTLNVSNKLKSILPFAAILLCPLMHFIMMPMMNKSGKDEEHVN